MPIYLIKRSDGYIWALMTTVTSLQLPPARGHRTTCLKSHASAPCHDNCLWGRFRKSARRGHHREHAMRAGETEQQMGGPAVAEQEKRIARQEALIKHLRKVGAPSDDALGLLGTTQDLLKTMRAHVERLSN